ncbi:MAG: SAM-dependent methyltransferase [Thermoprotei archaeon]
MGWIKGSQDKFYYKAKRAGYKSRSALKLLEILQQKSPKIGDSVLDLGCSPGGWSQVLSDAVGPTGRVTGIDLMNPHLNLPNFEFIEADIVKSQPVNGSFSSIYCDAAPKFIGVRDVDMARSQEIWYACLNWCDKTLAPGGFLVMKVFQSNELNEIRPQINERFSKIRFFKPKSSRRQSPEIYIICEGFKERAKKIEGSSSPGSNLMP